MELVARRISIGEIFSEWGATLGRHWRVILAWYFPFVILLAAIDIGISEWGGAFDDSDAAFPLGSLAAMLVGGIGNIFVYYLVLEQVLIRDGLMEQGQPKLFGSLFGASVLAGFGTVFGFLLLIVPGFILMARWSIMAPCIAVHRKGASAALEESWQATAQSQGAIATVMFLLVLGQLAATFGFAFLSGGFSDLLVVPGLNRDYVVKILGDQLVAGLVGAVGLLLAIAIYRLIAGPNHKLDEVFA